MDRSTPRRVFLAVLLFVPALSMGSAGIPLSVTAAPAQDAVWQVVADRPAGTALRTDLTGPSTLARFSKNAFDIVVATAARDSRRAFVMTMPMPDGTFGRFLATESSILAPDVAATVPDISTFRAKGIDDPSATARFGWTPQGFHAIVLTDSGTTYIDPYDTGNNEFHVSFRKQDHWHQGDAMRCLVGRGMDSAEPMTPLRSNNAFPISHGTSLRTYRLALAATAEYTTAAALWGRPCPGWWPPSTGSTASMSGTCRCACN